MFFLLKTLQCGGNDGTIAVAATEVGKQNVRNSDGKQSLGVKLRKRAENRRSWLGETGSMKKPVKYSVEWFKLEIQKNREQRLEELKCYL